MSMTRRWLAVMGVTLVFAACGGEEIGGAGGTAGTSGNGGSSGTGGSSGAGGSQGVGGSSGAPVDSGPQADSAQCDRKDGVCVLCADNLWHCDEGRANITPCPPNVTNTYFDVACTEAEILSSCLLAPPPDCLQGGKDYCSCTALVCRASDYPQDPPAWDVGGTSYRCLPAE
jgi:hypothetical protein